MEDLSLCSLFLLDVAKKIDYQVDTPYQSGHHTVKDDSKDILNMATYILEAMREIPFEDPVTKGMERIQAGWLRDFFKKLGSSECDVSHDDSESEQIIESNDIDYELYFVD